MLNTVRCNIYAEAVEVHLRSFEIWVQRKYDPVSTDHLHSVVVHPHWYVQVTAVLTIKQLSQLMREGCIVVHSVFMAESFHMSLWPLQK